MIEKLIIFENLISFIGKNYLTIGLPKYKGFNKNKRLIFNPKIINTIIILLILRAVIITFKKRSNFIR